MRASNRLTWVIAGVLGVSWLVPVTSGRNKKGDKVSAQVRDAEARRDWDRALQLAEEALSHDPADIGYQLDVTRLRFQAAQFHIDQGKKIREKGELTEALAEFEKAFAINPSATLAEEEIRRTREMIERSAKAPVATAEERGLTPAQTSRKESEARFASMMPMPELKPLNPQPITLKMNNQPPKVLFETLGKLAGVNVLFDPEYTQAGGKNQSIEFNGSTLEEALDYLAMVTKSFWKPLSANAIFVTQDNPTKRRDYEEQVVKVFYLQNVTTAQELQEIVTALRTVAEIQKVFTYQAQNAVIARAEADKIALAEKIVADLDKPKSEVVVDILVLQVSRSKTRNLAASIAPTGINSPIAFTPRSSISIPTTSSSTTGSTTASASTIIPLSNLNKVSSSDYSLTLPGGLIEALLSDNRTKVLQSPQVRAIDGQKVSLKIGQRVPYATGSFQPGIGGVGINPLVNTQFTFLDVGVNVDLTPKIHGPNEVSLQVDVEISSVADHVNLGGIDQPVVGQSKVSNAVRLRQGEVNLLGGLLQEQDTKTVTGVPGISAIPVLGRLFSSESVVRSESELVLALIPHIVRSPDITDVNLRSVAAGNSTTVKLNYAPRKPAGLPATPPPGPTPGTAAAPVPPPTPTAPPLAPPVVPVPGAPAAPVAPENRSATVPAGDTRLAFTPAQVTVQLNGTISANLSLENPRDLFAAPLKISFDPKVLRLNDVVQGGLLGGDGQQIVFSKNILNDQGETTITLSRFPGAPGLTASGSGTLVTLVFQAVGRGDTTVSIPQLTLRNTKGETINAIPPQLAVSVK